LNYSKILENMLYGYNQTIAEIKNIHIEIQEIQNDFIGCSAIGYEERAAPTNVFNSSVENEVVSREHKTEKLFLLKKQKELQIQKIDNALGLLEKENPEDLQLIQLRYFKKKPFKEIADILNRNSVYCIQRKGKILNKLTDLVFIIQY